MYSLKISSISKYSYTIKIRQHELFLIQKTYKKATLILVLGLVSKDDKKEVF